MRSVQANASVEDFWRFRSPEEKSQIVELFNEAEAKAVRLKDLQSDLVKYQKHKASVMSAQKSDNTLSNVNELSPYTKEEFEIMNLAVQGHSLEATAALLGQSEDQVALATPEDWYVGSIDPTDIFHKATRVLKESAATGKSKKVAADSLKSLREFWDKASKQFNDTQMDIH